MPASIYPFFFRHVIFPSLDLANGTHVSRVHRFLEKSQWLPIDRLLDLQSGKLRTTLDWAAANSGFYRSFWRDAPEERRARSLYPDLDGVPVITKEDLRRRSDEFPLPAYRGRVLRVRTSGSTGEPMVYCRSVEQESWFWALRIRMWQWGGYVPGEPYLTLNLNPREAWKKRVKDVLFRCSYHGFNANSHDVELVLEELTRKRVRHLIGYASSLYLLSEAMMRLGVGNPGVRSVLSTGDTLFPGYRRAIEKVFGVGVVDYYGAGGEGFHLASQCERRLGYHLHIENSVIEILRNRKPAGPGEIGEIVVTQLDNRAMPLIRYATQDVAVASAEGETCPCGRALPRIQSVQGRVPDIVLAPNGSALVVHFFTILFEHLSGIRQFQIIQSVPDRILAKIVTTGDYTKEATEAKIRDAVSRATDGSLAVLFEYVSDIPVSRSNKRRFVVSSLSTAPLALDSPFETTQIQAIPS